MTGFSLIFSALFAKTWRVYVVFMASEKLKKKVNIKSIRTEF